MSYHPSTEEWAPKTILRRTTDGDSTMRDDPLETRAAKALRDVAVDTTAVLEHGDHGGQHYLQEVGDEVIITIARTQLANGEEMFRAQFYVPIEK